MIRKQKTKPLVVTRSWNTTAQLENISIVSLMQQKLLGEKKKKHEKL